VTFAAVTAILWLGLGVAALPTSRPAVAATTPTAAVNWQIDPAHPGSQPGDARLTITCYPPLGPSIVRTITVPARSRHTVEIFGTSEGVGPGLSAVGIAVASDQPVLVEKPTYSANPTTYGATVTRGYSPTPGFF
jgi:hypothetical protein